VTVLFAEGVPEQFAELPGKVQRQAARCIELLAKFPLMYPIRRRGLMRGYRYFLASRYLFYYSVSSAEVRVAAIIPAAMRRA
jgi:plasmid stabilization system protein ParE